MEALGHGNDEIAVMRLVLDEYEKSHAPAYIIFVTDGGFASESSLRDFLVKSSHLPIFWRFLGFGEENSQMFHRLNWLPGRYTINADFSLISDFKQMNKEYFYDTLLGKFPLWLREASKLGIVPK